MNETRKLIVFFRKAVFVGGPLLLLAITFSAFAGPSLQVSQDWTATYPGQAGVAVVVDGSGNSYVTGPSLPDAAHNFNHDIVLVKYNAAGAQVWAREFDETGDATFGSDVPFWLALDPAGNVIVTGKSFLDGSGIRFVTLKYDSNGNLLWKARYQGGFESRRVATDAAGNVYVAGVSGTGLPANYVTVKYDPNGNLLWARIYNGPFNPGLSDDLRSLAVTPGGQVAVTGRSGGGVTIFDVATVLYDTNGNELWARRFDGAAHDSDAGNDVAFGPAGEVYVGGHTSPTSQSLIDTLLLKYSPAGDLQWVKTHNGADNNSDSIARIAVDSQGNVLATGFITPASFYADIGTLKYDPNGNLLWVRLYDGPIANDEEIARALAIGPGNSVYVTGYQEGGAKIATVKYDTNGAQLWAATFTVPNAIAYSGNAIALDPSGNATVNGQFPILTLHYSDSGQPGPTPTPSPTVGPTPTATATATPGGCVTKCLRSTQIQLTPTATGVSGQVTVKDENGVAQRGATVSVTWNLPNGSVQNKSAKANSSGIASFNVNGGAGLYTLTVTNIVKSGYTFDAANSLLVKSITK
jgi:hypothetical protein